MDDDLELRSALRILTSKMQFFLITVTTYMLKRELCVSGN